MEFWADVSRKQQSPITQYFAGPFTKPVVIISDFREAKDLLLRRGKLLDHGTLNTGLWFGAIPHHFVGMPSSDPKYAKSKNLSNDLMTPSFLHNVSRLSMHLVGLSLTELKVSIPASYQKTLNFINLWQLKAQIANEHPFIALEDFNFLTSDIICAAALGISDSDSDTVKHSKRLQASNLPKGLPKLRHQVYPFPEYTASGLLEATHLIADSITGARTASMPKLYWFLTNLRPSISKAQQTRTRILQNYIDQASQTTTQTTSGTQYRAAVDYIVSREIAAAGKEGRQPALTSRVIHDSLFGYVLGGQSTTHSVLCFMMKRLSVRQDVQSTLRAHLYEAYAPAFGEGRNPTVEEFLAMRLPYLDAVIEETMRLNVTAPVLIREALQDLDFLNHTIPKGTNIFCTLWGPSYDEPAFDIDEKLRSKSSQAHRDETPGDWTRSGFAPAEFYPERWLRKEGECVVFDIKNGPTLGLGAGSRECWGKRLAYHELRLIATLIIWNFDLLPLPAELLDTEVVDFFVAKPKTCYVRLRSCSPRSAA